MDAVIVGREAELDTARAFLASSAGGVRGLVLEGEAGIGKTALWRAAIEDALAVGHRVLRCTGNQSELRMSFVGLSDLVGDVADDVLPALPAPQARALEVALLRAAPDGAPPEFRAIASGFLNALRALTARGPLVVAVDDVQWLDLPSAKTLVFAARRLERSPVVFLLARRLESSCELERVLEPAGLVRIEVGPLSVGATRRLLSDRLGLSLRRQLLRRIVESTLGNPLFALEVGRGLAELEPLKLGDDIPLPDAVEDLLGRRVERLTGPVRRLLLAVALSGELHAPQLARIAAPPVLDDAVDAGVLLVDADRVRASHPLLAAAAKKRSRASERRELHFELARAVTDEELRALHLALATELPDAELATTVSAAAAGASARGAAQEAVLLAEHALRLTPPGSAERSDRLLCLGGYLDVAGEPVRMADLLTPVLDSLPQGAARVRACLLLCESRGEAIRSDHDRRRYRERALVESGSDPGLRAHVLGKMAANSTVIRVERIAQAEAWAVEALSAAASVGPDVERLALFGLAWARSLNGRCIDDVCARFRAASPDAYFIAGSPERIAGQRLVWRGELDGARLTFTRLLDLAEERGELVSYALNRLHLCELELRAGGWQAAARLLDEWADPPERELLIWPMYERCQALLAAGRGLPAVAERWAAEAMADAEALGVRWDLLEASRASGIAALLNHEPQRAAECLRRVWNHTLREGVDDPGAFPVAPDLVEALVELRELEEARYVTERLTALAAQQQHPWGLATAKRCGALVQLASAPDEEASVALEEAVTAYAGLGLRFDRARSLLAHGRAFRRSRKWGRARGTLEQAVAAFDELGSPGWAEAARSELARVGARRPRPQGELTPTERRVAELAASGRANKEIAHELFISVHTVEVHLSHTYAKLGIRSRGQLSSLLSVRV